MFDEASEELIRKAPPLEGLDLDSLGKQLTDAFSHLVALRVRRRGASGTVDDPEVSELLSRLARLAQAYEAYVHILPESSNRDAAAYVSASAYKVLAAERELVGQPPSLLLDRTQLPPSVSAALLFLISGYSSEAAEVSRSARLCELVPVDSPFALLRAVGLVAEGRLPEVAEITVSRNPEEADLESLALDAIWRRLLAGVKELAGELLGEQPSTFPELGFEQVFTLTRASEPDGSSESPTPTGTMPAPHHLAALLLQLPRALRDQAIANVPRPGGSGGSGYSWEDFLRRMARRRPYLWPSHQVAIGCGYLDRGISAVVSFPTGSGKSVVATLRVGATLARGKRAIYLAPTHALVHQVRSDLSATFPKYDVSDSLVSTAEYSEVELDQPDIAVMTPERCLALLGSDQDAFKNVETIVFDECHLLHPNGSGADRRALDATLCLLHLTDTAIEADLVLMSAMMSNPSELAEWLTRVLKKESRPLQISWKPTRQVRGCVVFPDDEIESLKLLLSSERPKAERAKKQRDSEARKKGKKPKGKSASIPVKVKKQLNATPHALFSLRSTWASKASSDYSLLRLREDPVRLAAGGRWNLIANRNVVSADIASDFARSRIKTLVFAQARRACDSIAREAHSALSTSGPAPEPTDAELRALRSASTELGGEKFSFANPELLALSHHGLLLPSERFFNESRFKREDGISVLCATSTLAQGMNLPAQAVVIAGEDRYDQQTGKAEVLEAHELLNAAGRAGRAGFFSQGIVVIVPSQVVQFNPKDAKIGAKWIKLQEDLFSRSDQCLRIVDPIEAILDHVQLGTAAYDEEISYLIDRLPREEGGELDTRARSFLAKSLSVFLSRKSEDIYRSQVDALLTIGKARSAAAEDWQLGIATSAGIPASIVADIGDELERTGIPGSVGEAVEWLLAWFHGKPERIFSVVRASNLERTVGRPPEAPGRRPTWLASALSQIETLFAGWLDGEPLASLEESLPARSKSGALGRLERARAFALGLAADFGYGVGLLAQIARARHQQGGTSPTRDLTIAASCVREGQATAEGLALQYCLRRASRVEVHERLAELDLSAEVDTVDFPTLRKIVSRAHADS